MAETGERPETALSKVRDLDLGRVLAGPIVAKFGDMGAEVIKVEHPVPATTRAHGSHPRSAKTPHISAPLIAISAASASISPRKKVGNSYWNWPRTATSWLRISAPELPNVSVSTMPVAKVIQTDLLLDFRLWPRRTVGPTRCLRLCRTGHCRHHRHTGEPDRIPIRCAGAISDYGTGLWSVVAVLFALMERERTSKGQHIDMAMNDTTMLYLSHVAAMYFKDGITPNRVGNGHEKIVPTDVYQTKDEPLMVLCGNDVCSSGSPRRSAGPI